jgi:hypothetical protein
LGIVSEIYSGHGSKMYDMLKDVPTDETFMASYKGIPRYELESLMTVIAITNHYRALIVAKQDRRWLIPRMAEVKFTLDKSTEFRRWLRHGGLAAILQWALDFDAYIAEGEEAPMTTIKQEMIDHAISEVDLATQEIAERLAAYSEDKQPAPAAIAWLSVREDLRARFPEMKENDAVLRILMAKTMGAGSGWFGLTIKERIYVVGRPDYVLGNAMLHAKVRARSEALRGNLEIEERNKIIRDHLRLPHELLPVRDPEEMRDKTGDKTGDDNGHFARQAPQSEKRVSKR